MSSKKLKPDSILKGFVIGATVLLILAIVQFYTLAEPSSADFYGTFTGLVKIIIVGFLVGALGCIVPQLLPFKKYDFEMKKEAHERYSEAKTEIDNLPHSLQFFEDAESALKFIKHVHTKKHLSETYAEYLPEKNPMGKYPSNKIWPTNYQPYRKIEKCRDTIQQNRTKWNSLGIADRYRLLENAWSDIN